MPAPVGLKHLICAQLLRCRQSASYLLTCRMKPKPTAQWLPRQPRRSARCKKAQRVRPPDQACLKLLLTLLLKQHRTQKTIQSLQHRIANPVRLRSTRTQRQLLPIHTNRWPATNLLRRGLSQATARALSVQHSSGALPVRRAVQKVVCRAPRVSSEPCS